MSEPQYYLEIGVDIPQQHVDAVCNFIIENISNGIILEDEEDAQSTLVKFYLPEEDDKDYDVKLNEYFGSLAEMDDTLDSIPELQVKQVQNIEWEEAYKKSVPAVLLAGDVAVRPPWEEKPEKIKYDILIEPKMAFGTGTHETTRTCLIAIRENFKEGMSLLDMGCGSGILAVLADKMKAGYIKAVDYDKIAVDNCWENFELNRVVAKHDVLHGSIETCLDDSPYDFVCANIIKVTVLEMLEELARLTNDQGILVLSGLLDHDVPEIETALKAFGLDQYEIIAENEWRTFVIKK